MHAQAGTIGYKLILDEASRQEAKQASRIRTFERASDLGSCHRPGLIPVRVETIFGGKSTPSTAASPPHDAEAAREAARLESAKHLEFLRAVRAWADGEPGVFPLDEAAKAIETVARVRKVLDGLEHTARQYAQGRYTYSHSVGINIAVEELKGALR